MRKLFVLFFVFVFSVTITGCGGGGGSTSIPSTPTAVVNTLTIKSLPTKSKDVSAFVGSHTPIVGAILEVGEKEVAVKNGFNVECTGNGLTAIESITLVDQNNQQVGAPQTLDSNHQANVGGIITLKEKSSQTFFVVITASTDLSTVNGQQVSCKIISVDTNDAGNGKATVVGTLPIYGDTVTMDNTLPAGTVHVSVSPTNSAYTIAIAGSKYVNVAKFCYTTSSNGKLTRAGFKLVSGSPDSIIQMTVWHEDVMVGTAIFAGTNIAIVMLTQDVLLNSNVCTELTVRVDTSKVGTGFTGVEGDIIKIEADPTNTKSVDLSSGSTVGAVGTTETPGVRMFSSVPICSAVPIVSTGNIDGVLFKFKCTANGGDVGINQLKFNTATKGLSMIGINLSGCLDQDCASLMPGYSGGQILPSNISFPGGSGVISIAPQTSVIIPAGETRFFVLHAVGTSAVDSTWSAVTTLLGDPSFPNPINVSNVFGNVTSVVENILWTPNPANTSPTIVNGVGIIGIPANGISQEVSGNIAVSAPIFYTQQPDTLLQVVTPPPFCGNGLNITSYPTCSCPAGQVSSGQVCVLSAPPPPGPI